MQRLNALSRQILCIIYLCNTCVVFLIFKKYVRLTLYYYFSLKEYIPWFEVEPFLLENLDFQVTEVWKVWNCTSLKVFILYLPGVTLPLCVTVASS